MDGDAESVRCECDSSPGGVYAVAEAVAPSRPLSDP